MSVIYTYSGNMEENGKYECEVGFMLAAKPVMACENISEQINTA